MMGLFGKQHRFCPNCGKPMYDDWIRMDRVKAMCCSKECIDQWELKYTQMVLGKDAPVTD